MRYAFMTVGGLPVGISGTWNAVEGTEAALVKKCVLDIEESAFLP
jgi:hypothetical protein